MKPEEIERVEPMAVSEQGCRPWILPGAAACLIPLGMGLGFWAARRPDWVERHYSQSLFEHLVPVLASVSAKLPFSLAEFLVLMLLLRLLVGLFRTIPRVVGRRAGTAANRIGTLGLALLRLAGLAGVLYTAYLLCWGFNHYRSPFADVAGWEVNEPSTRDLAEAASSLLEQLVPLREGLDEDENGVSRMPLAADELHRIARDAFEQLSDLHPSLKKAPGIPKRPFAAPLMTASWISGIYSPFTAEATINDRIPEAQLGFVTCHELAHSLGFAREDEANFLAFLACRSSGDPAVRYSGALAAWRHLTAALATAGSSRLVGLNERLSDPVKRDIRAIGEYWRRERTDFTAIATRMNNAYLKSQGQAEGVASYGLVVNLLVADWRRNLPDFTTKPLMGALTAVRDRTVRIAFVGGCLTSGGEEEERLTYSDLVGDALRELGVDARILDLSACHQTISQSAQNVGLAIDWKADIVVLEPGAGDLEIGTRLESILQSLDWMVFAARRAGARLLLLESTRPELTPVPGPALGLSRLLRNQSESRGIPCVSDFAEGVGGVRESLRNDLEHPNSRGIRILADRIIPRLRLLVSAVRQDWALERVASRKRRSRR